MHPKQFPSLNVRPSKPNRRLRKFIMKKRWETLLGYLSTAEGRMEVENFENNGNEGQTALHLACNLDPPLKVIHKLFEIRPCAVSQLDQSGENPLHVVAAVCESGELMKFLADQCPKAVSIVNREGKTPLILLCEHARFDEDDEPLIMAAYEKAWVEIIDAAMALCNAAPPDMVTVEDSSGKSALEYAIMNNANIELVKFLMIKSAQAMATKTNAKDTVTFLVMKSKQARHLEMLLKKHDEVTEGDARVEKKFTPQVSKAA